MGVRIVVVGDAGTGKSSLILTAANNDFPEVPPPVCPGISLLHNDVPIEIVDTSSRQVDKARLDQECKRADTIVVTYSCDKPESVQSLSSYWLPELQKLGVQVPIIVVGCKLDLRDKDQPGLEQLMAPLMAEFEDVQTCLECSSLEHVQVLEAFHYAQMSVLYPTGPLFDREHKCLHTKCIRALKRIFMLCDWDCDWALNDSELNGFQLNCFGTCLQPEEIEGVKRMILEKVPQGVTEHGITFYGFLYLHVLFIGRGECEITWISLRKFGYDNELKLRDDQLQYSYFQRAPNQNMELTEKAISFLTAQFSALDTDNDGTLCPSQLDELFSTAPSNPWDEGLAKGIIEINDMGGVTLKGFLSWWALLTLLDPMKSFAQLIYIGYSAEASTAFRKTRCGEPRAVYQCYVFGPTSAGKSGLFNALVGSPCSKMYQKYTEGDKYGANILDAKNKILVLKEIPEGTVPSLLKSKNALAVCDVAVFVYDSSDQTSRKDCMKVLAQVAAHGHQFPCILVNATADQEPNPKHAFIPVEECDGLNLEAALVFNVMQLEHIGEFFGQIMKAAENPYLRNPFIVKRSCHFVKRSLKATAIGAAALFIGFAAYWVYDNYKERSSS